jgi:hypothetical protein
VAEEDGWRCRLDTTSVGVEGSALKSINRKIILDTNLWSYVGDEGSVDALRAALGERHCVVLLPPSMLIELLRNPDSHSRAQHIAAIREVRGRRLASEAQLCAADFVGLVKRRRPQWMRSIADAATVAKFNRRWTKEWWQWAAEDPDKAHEIVVENPTVAEDNMIYQRDIRQKQLAENFASDYSHLRISTDDPLAAAPYLPGWDGHKVEAWRFDIAFRYWHFMNTRSGSPQYGGFVQTMRDWIGSYVEMRTATANPVDFANLFLEEAEPADLRRDWIRTAMAWTQTTMKIGKGNAADEQHSAYLVDADLFLTADKKLVTALAEVRRQATFTFADLRLVDLQHGKIAAVDAVTQALEPRA